MYFILKISSKNKRSLNSFYKVFYNKNGKNLINSIPKISKNTKMSILKSPHVSKIAQEQFEYSLISKQISIYNSKKLKFLLFLKTIVNKIFPDIKIIITILLDKNNQKLFNRKLLNPKNFNLNFTKKSYSPTNSKSYLKIIETFGEILIKKNLFR